MTAPQLPGLENSPELDAVREWLRKLHGPRWQNDPRARYVEAYAVHRIKGTPKPEPVSTKTWRKEREKTARRIMLRARIDRRMIERAAARALEDSSECPRPISRLWRPCIPWGYSSRPYGCATK